MTAPAPHGVDRLVDAVVIGGSAGALDALKALLGALPAGYRLPLLLVVHLPRHQPSTLATTLERHCRLPVCEAEDKAPIAAGTLHVAPPDYHLLVDVGPALALSVDPPVHYAQPAIDVLFESAAEAYRERLAGVVLSGANADGAAGLAATARAGGLAFVQDPDGAIIPVMPAAALAACPDAMVLDAAGLGQALARLDPAEARP